MSPATVAGPGSPDGESFSLEPLGPFSLVASARFAERFPAGQGGGDAPRLDLAFSVEPDWQAVGVRVTEAADGVRAEVVSNRGAVPPGRIRSQVERILSLDVDGSGFPAVGERDDVVGDLQLRYPGLRPVLFHSPYEAAAWAIIGHRIRMTQAAVVKERLAEELGDRIDFGDRHLHAFPPPERLAELGPTSGLTERKVSQLRALAVATAEGRLDAGELRARPRDEALAQLQTLPGIGPFSAELVLLRGAGEADGFPLHERRVHRAMAAAYDLGSDPALDVLQAVADRWRPYRTWVCLLLRRRLEDERSDGGDQAAAPLPRTVTPSPRRR